jgi:hypothetical protein
MARRCLRAVNAIAARRTVSTARNDYRAKGTTGMDYSKLTQEQAAPIPGAALAASPEYWWGRTTTPKPSRAW